MYILIKYKINTHFITAIGCVDRRNKHMNTKWEELVKHHVPSKLRLKIKKYVPLVLGLFVAFTYKLLLLIKSDMRL